MTRMNLSYRLGWVAFRSFFRLYNRLTIYNAGRVPETGPVILASNHASFYDPPVIGACLTRKINYLARASLFNKPLVGPLIRSWNAVPVDRDGGSGRGLRTILERLNKGGAIIVFPEGTRSSDGILKPGQAGVGLTVLKSAAPVVPVRVFGSFNALPRHRWFPLPARVSVKFGPPMAFAREREEARHCARPRARELYKLVSERIMHAIATLEPTLEKDNFP